MFPTDVNIAISLPEWVEITDTVTAADIPKCPSTQSTKLKTLPSSSNWKTHLADRDWRIHGSGKVWLKFFNSTKFLMIWNSILETKCGASIIQWELHQMARCFDVFYSVDLVLVLLLLLRPLVLRKHWELTGTIHEDSTKMDMVDIIKWAVV